jgi:hypothetical protein
VGQPAARGGVRLHPDNARIFYKLVEAAGKENSLITFVNQATSVSGSVSRRF